MATIMGDRIKQLRKQMHLTQEELADQLNERFGLSINKSMISKWENGKGDPYLSYAKYLAFHFGVNLDYLVGLTDKRSFVYYFDDWYENQEKERIRLERIERMTSMFEQLNEKGQDKIFGYATDLLNSNMYSCASDYEEAEQIAKEIKEERGGDPLEGRVFNDYKKKGLFSLKAKEVKEF